ncbi:KSP1 Serine/threonine-protein kinase KSP1 [Candida maltosa Xu316]
MEEYNQYDKGQLLRGRYVRLADLSQGSYGLVSVAKDTKVNDRLVAVKFIFPIDFKKKQSSSSSSSDSLLDEAKKEIKIHRILGDHPNISRLLDHFDTFLILQYYPRGDLYEAIHSGSGPVTTPDIKSVFNQLLDGISYCHSKGVYHRDLKPENILIDQNWNLKICDFGLASTTRMVSDGDEVGSNRYMAPELFENQSYDAALADIWSMGVIFVTVVFKKNPFEFAKISDTRFKLFLSNSENLLDMYAMSYEFFDVLAHCLTINPENRSILKTAQELKNLTTFTIWDEEVMDSTTAITTPSTSAPTTINTVPTALKTNGSSSGSGSGSRPGSIPESFTGLAPAIKVPNIAISPVIKGAHTTSTTAPTTIAINKRAEALASTDPIPMFRNSFNFGHGFGNGKPRWNRRKKNHHHHHHHSQTPLSQPPQMQMQQQQPSSLQQPQCNNYHTPKSRSYSNNQSLPYPSPGKYIPPYLRQKSPVIEPLVEEFDKLSFDNEEVFHLED